MARVVRPEVRYMHVLNMFLNGHLTAAVLATLMLQQHQLVYCMEDH